MKLRLSVFIRLYWYNKVETLMKTLSPDIIDKNSDQLVDYWAEVYKQKTRRLLKQESDRLFPEVK